MAAVDSDLLLVPDLVQVALEISAADARDRAEELATAADALTLLLQAEIVGDEVLARAIGARARAMAAQPGSEPDWADVACVAAARAVEAGQLTAAAVVGASAIRGDDA